MLYFIYKPYRNLHNLNVSGDNMENNELEMIKKEIEEVREQINTYIQYPEIFEDELTEASKQIDILINKYIYLSK